MREKLTKKNQQTGFTIIEVVLVLAIAGLIFLIVFLALPQLQKSRRDTQRKADVGRMIAALDSYASNNNGSYPNGVSSAALRTSFNNFAAASLSSGFVDPSFGSGYGRSSGTNTTPAILFDQNAVILASGDTNTGPSSLGVIRYLINAKCSGGSASYSEGVNNVAIIMRLEAGTYCQSNN